MIFFNKEDGYPMNISIETISFREEDMEYESGEEYESVVFDESGEIISEFKHDTLRGRSHWVNGFFAGLEFQK